jgi:hypothetical protein
MKYSFTIMCTLILSSFYFNSIAQNSSLPVPLNIQKAIEKGTRTMEGKPGPAYWQNSSDYVIKAEFEPAARKITGQELITYTNNSPDSLNQIVIRLYQDLFRNGNMRDFEINPEDVNNGVDIQKIFINNSKLENMPKRSGTNLVIPLEVSIAPKSKIELKINWSLILSKYSNIRMGTYDSTSFFVGYWFPQVAVYDDIDGWDMVNYTGSTEMYNDFNNFNVELTVPKGFIVWSTGVLQNPDDVYSPETNDKYKKAYNTSNVVNIINENDYKKGLVTKNSHKLHYKIIAANVPDFAFATSDHYLWDGLSTIVDKKSLRKTFVSAAYNKKSKDFYNVAVIARNSIESFSTHIPGVPFPYPKLTVFNGGGGMEYPMIVNDGSDTVLQGTVHVTSHEISHTYFPFFMGINERKYAWMDEGWATMLPFDFQSSEAPGYDPRARNSSSFSELAGKESDIPPIVLSYELRNPSYRTASYRRPGAAYDFLRGMLGDELFKSCLIGFMNKWNGKHPLPYDFFFDFNKTSGQNLDWFFKPWFFELKYPDLSLELINANETNAKVKVVNKGGLPLPVQINLYYLDGQKEKVYDASAKIWEKGNSYIDLNLELKKKISKIELGSPQIPDVNLNDNSVKIN